MTNRPLITNVLKFWKWLVGALAAWLLTKLLDAGGIDKLMLEWFNQLWPSIVPVLRELGTIMLYTLIFGAGATTQEWLQRRKTRKKLEAEAAEKTKEKVKTKQAPKPWDIERIGHDCMVTYESMKNYGSPYSHQRFGHVEIARVRKDLKNLQSLGIPTPVEQEHDKFSPERAVKFLGVVGPYVKQGLVQEAKIEATKALFA